MDIKKSLINSEIISVNSTDELSENNDIVDKTYFIKYDSEIIKYYYQKMKILGCLLIPN